MKKLYRNFILFIISVVVPINLYSAGNYENSRLSPLTHYFISLNSEKNIQDQSVYINDPQFNPIVFYKIDNRLFVGGLVQYNEKFDFNRASELGVEIPTRLSNILTFKSPVEKIEDFVNLEGIEFIEIDVPVFLQLDEAKNDVNVFDVYQGIQLENGYKGNDVLVGVVDAGFDFTHPDYASRIRRVWIQSRQGVAPRGFRYGHEIINVQGSNIKTDIDYATHGSHVTGIAAGAGNLIPQYQGIAPEAGLVLVSYAVNENDILSTGMSSIIDGVSYIFNYADDIRKPCVVNLSLGNHIGPHDGSGLFARAADELTGYGKIICVAAGNSGSLDLHIMKEFTPADTMIITEAVNLDDNSSSLIIDAWGQKGANFCMTICTISGNSTYCSETFCAEDFNGFQRKDYIPNSNIGANFYINRSDFNGKPRIFSVVDISSTSSPILVVITGNDGIVHMWNAGEGGSLAGEFRKNNRIKSVEGDKFYSLNGMGAHSEALITVGAYTSKNRYRNYYNNLVSIPFFNDIGEIAAFSSTGPTVDGRIKPDITAPGNVVVSTLNSFTSVETGQNTSVVGCQNFGGRTYCYGAFAGTSMATPVVTGVIALMLEANPDLTPAIAKEIISLTAIEDQFTGDLPAEGNIFWGHGKINAHAAVLMAESFQVNRPKDFDVLFYPNPVHRLLKYNLDSAYSGDYTFELYDLLGNKVLDWKDNVDNQDKTGMINLPNLAQSAYFIRINYKDKFIIHRKIIKLFD